MLTIIHDHRQDVIRAVLDHPEIFDVISEDDAVEYEVNTTKDCFLTLWVTGKLAGLYILSPVSSVELDIHAHILPAYREEYARSLTRLMYEWLLEHSDIRFQKVTASVPAIYPNVMRFCGEFGMVCEGQNRKAWRKNGALHDKFSYGITREEIKAFLIGVTV